MHLFSLLSNAWASAILVVGSVCCAVGELENEGVLCRNAEFGSGTPALDGAIWLE